MLILALEANRAWAMSRKLQFFLILSTVYYNSGHINPTTTSTALLAKQVEDEPQSAAEVVHPSVLDDAETNNLIVA